MIDEIRIIDRVYSDPEAVRAHALEQPFEKSGNYPGNRTAPVVGADSELLKTTLEAWLGHSISYWPQEENSCYQLCLDGSQTWVHHDETQWGAVLFLTPDAIVERVEEDMEERHGIGFYRRWVLDGPTPLDSDWIFDGHDSPDWNLVQTSPDDWETVVEVSGMFNRLVAFRGNYYHRSLIAGFGDTPETGRLTQVFFWDSEDQPPINPGKQTHPAKARRRKKKRR